MCEPVSEIERAAQIADQLGFNVCVFLPDIEYFGLKAYSGLFFPVKISEGA
jgi:hypothetical protein